MKIVLLRELVDTVNCGNLVGACPQLEEWHDKVQPIIASNYAQGWLKELKNDRSPLAREISDCYLAKLRRQMEKNGLWTDGFLTLELDYELKAVAEMQEAVENFATAKDNKELLSAYMAEVVTRRWGSWMEGQEVEVTGCRFALVAENPAEPISEKQQKFVREYLACFGYAKSADTPAEVCRFIRRLEQDVPEIGDVVSVVREKTIGDVDLELMEKNAWLFFANRERILADERLAGTKVNIRSGAAPASFSLPSIAAYLHFWQTNKGIVESDDCRGLLIRLAGFGGSGCNTCSVVWNDGATGHISVSPFIDTWTPFVKLIRQYPPKENGITLEELINKLNNNL